MLEVASGMLAQSQRTLMKLLKIVRGKTLYLPSYRFSNISIYPNVWIFLYKI